MKQVNLKQLNIWFCAAIMMVLASACSSSDVSLDLKPVDFQSAKNLAKTIARTGNCGSFEDNGNNNFTCQRGIPPKDDMFTISIFYDVAGRDKAAAELSVNKDFSLFKIGQYFIISKFVKPVGGTNDTVIIKTTAQDYTGFPGELSTDGLKLK